MVFGRPSPLALSRAWGHGAASVLNVAPEANGGTGREAKITSSGR